MVQSYAPVLKKKKLDINIEIGVIIVLSSLAVFCGFMMRLICFFSFCNELIFKFFFFVNLFNFEFLLIL